MTKKIIVIFTALLLTASFCACSGGKGNGETSATSSDTVNIESSTTSESATDEETGTSSNSGNTETETAGDPQDYSFEAKDDTVYAIVNLTLRTADYQPVKSVVAGTELKRVEISTSSDEFDGYWSKVTYNNETYYVATKFVTLLADPDEGFTSVEKTVILKTSSIKVHILPEFGHDPIAWFQAGDSIKVLAEKTGDDIGWYKVECVVYGETEPTIGYIVSTPELFEKTAE